MQGIRVLTFTSHSITSMMESEVNVSLKMEVFGRFDQMPKANSLRVVDWLDQQRSCTVTQIVDALGTNFLDPERRCRYADHVFEL